MTNEEMQSTMQFIVEQQAQFAANIQMLQEGQVRADERFAKHEERFARIEDSLERVVGLVGAIAQAQARTEVNLAATDERLNNLISVFERHLQDNRNGKP
jgi:3-methyladenine DNA glycosylase/8-oxoguanine DNA glycosylase